MPDLAPNYLDPRALAAVAPLELRARLIVEGLMTGMHRSPYYGFAIEFAQHRQYAPGDDLRHLDWKVFGRTDKLYLKQHQKETNLDLMLVVDVSGSMAYSSFPAQRAGSSNSGASPAAAGAPWRKYDHAAALAATLAYLALRQQDRVGLVLVGDRIHASVRPSNARGHWRSIVESLASAAPQTVPRRAAAHAETARPADLARLFEHLVAKLGQRSLIVLLGDLLDDPAAFERGLARLHHRRHDLIVLQTLDPAELNFPFRGPAEFYGLEGDGRLNLDPAALRREYLESLQAHLTRLEDVTRRFGFDYLLLDSSQPLGAPLSQFLARRAARAGRRI